MPCDHQFSIKGEVIFVVTKYKYLGCVIDDFLDLNSMVDDRAEAGRWTMDSLLRAAVGVLYGCTFRKLLFDLVQSVLLYGAEAWGCLRGLESMEHIQLRALLLWYPQVSQDITFSDWDGSIENAFYNFVAQARLNQAQTPFSLQRSALYRKAMITR